MSARQRLGGHAVGHRTERPEVARRRRAAPHHGLRSHVERRAEQVARAGQRREVLGERDPEVRQQPAPALSVHEHVRGLEVAVDDPAGVAMVEPFGDAREHVEDLLQRRSPLLQERIERAARHVAHGEVLQTRFKLAGVDRDDVGMLDVRHGVDLTREPLREDRIQSEFRPYELQRDQTSRRALNRAEDLPEAAGTKALLDHIVADGVAWREHARLAAAAHTAQGTYSEDEPEGKCPGLTAGTRSRDV